MEAVQKQVQHLKAGDVFALLGRRYEVKSLPEREGDRSIVYVESAQKGHERFSFPAAQEVRVLRGAVV